MKKILDTTFRFGVCLNETKRTTICSKWKEVQLFSNCTSSYGKESEGLNLCSLFDLQRGAFLC